jgi:hypothetical protein
MKHFTVFLLILTLWLPRQLTAQERWYFTDSTGLEFQNNQLADTIMPANYLAASQARTMCTTININDSTYLNYYTLIKQCYNWNEKITIHKGRNEKTFSSVKLGYAFNSTYISKNKNNEYFSFYTRFYTINSGNLVYSKLILTEDTIYTTYNQILIDSTELIGVNIVVIDNYSSDVAYIIAKKTLSDYFYILKYDKNAGFFVIKTQDFSNQNPSGLIPSPVSFISNKTGDKLISFYGSFSDSSIIKIYNFDRCSGVISVGETLKIQNPDSCRYESVVTELSRDNSKLYIACANCLSQVDIKNADKTQTLLWKTSGYNTDFIPYQTIGVIKRGFDNKIYVAHAFDYTCQLPAIFDTTNYLGIIEYPDSAGINCNFKVNGIYIGKKNKRLLPTTESTWATDPWYPVPLSSFTAGRDTAVCGGAAVPLGYVGPDTLTYVWEPAAGLSCTACPNPVATPNTTTRYRLTIFDPDDFCQVPAPDSVLVTVLPRNVLGVSLPPDTAICPGAGLTLSPVLTGTGSVLWSTGATTPSITVEPTATTTYTLTYSGTACDVPDTATVTVTVLPPDASPCRTIRPDATATQIRIYPNPTTGPLTVELPAGIRTDVELLNAIGQGLLRVVNRSGTVHLDLTPYPDGYYYLMVKGQRTRVVLRK